MLRLASTLALIAGATASAQRASASEAAWASLQAGTIPSATENAPTAATYHFVTEYTLLDPQGRQTGSHVVTSEFVATGKSVRWTTVAVGPTAGHGEPVGASEHRAYMEGFEYPRDGKKITAPGFFAAFPADANDERNLVWDELMFDSFVGELDRLRLNVPVAALSGDVMLAGSGTFTNKRIDLTLVGMGRRNGEDCLLVHYEALLNRFTITAGPATVSGRSDYFGDIWVSIRTRQIEYGTLLEEVAGSVSMPNAGPQAMHVLRAATLEHAR
jgi:hypothetical protein